MTTLDEVSLKLYGTCPVCGKPRVMRVSRTEKNPGRKFVCCENRDHKSFAWLDELQSHSRTPTLIRTSGKPIQETSPLFGESFSSVNLIHQTENEKSKDSPKSGDKLGFLDVAVVIPEKKPEFIPSVYQERIFDFVKHGNGHAVIEAVAGSGKTESLVRSLEFTDAHADVAFTAFNRHIAQELSERAPSHVHVSTLHSLGYQNARETLGNNLTVNEYKLQDLWEVLDMSGNLNELKPTAIKLVNLCKSSLKEPTQESLDWLIDHYGIEANGDIERVYELASKLYSNSIKIKDELDYTDMVFWNATGDIPTHKFDVLFIDELQDFSPMQLQMALKSVKPDGRIIGVGDSRQAIYGWSGAGIDSMDQARDLLKGESLPLSICYRCHRGAIRLAQEIVPQIEARPAAPEGIVQDIPALGAMQAGDMVLCRINAPLVEPCFDLIRRGIKATIRGRDIGNGLISMLLRAEKRSKAIYLVDVLAWLQSYVRQEVAKLKKVRKELRASSLEDQLETLVALSDGCQTVGQVKQKINQVFSDDKASVTFSSIHRAKGLQAERVFILKPELIPFPKAEKDWEIAQEWNCKYIALTRPKLELYFVKDN